MYQPVCIPTAVAVVADFRTISNSSIICDTLVTSTYSLLAGKSRNNTASLYDNGTRTEHFTAANLSISSKNTLCDDNLDGIVLTGIRHACV